MWNGDSPVQDEGDEVLGLQDHPLAGLQLLGQHAAEDAGPVVVVVAHGHLDPLADVRGDHGRGDELRVRVRLRGARPAAVVLEQRDELDAPVGGGRGVQPGVDAEDPLHLLPPELGQGPVVIRRLDDDVADSHSAHPAAGPVLPVDELLRRAEGRVLVGHRPHEPAAVHPPHHQALLGGERLGPRAEGAAAVVGLRARPGLGGAVVLSAVLGPRRPLGRDDHPLPGRDVLAQLRHGAPGDGSGRSTMAGGGAISRRDARADRSSVRPGPIPVQGVSPCPNGEWRGMRSNDATT